MTTTVHWADNLGACKERWRRTDGWRVDCSCRRRGGGRAGVRRRHGQRARPQASSWHSPSPLLLRPAVGRTDAATSAGGRPAGWRLEFSLRDRLLSPRRGRWCVVRCGDLRTLRSRAWSTLEWLTPTAATRRTSRGVSRGRRSSSR